MREQEVDNQDVAAAVEWLKNQPFVQPDMLIMSGVSFGGIQTVLASEKGLGVKAFIPFAPIHTVFEVIGSSSLDTLAFSKVKVFKNRRNMQ